MLYAFIFALAIVFVKNFSFFSSYLKNYSSYVKVDLLKLQPQVWFITGFSVDQLDLGLMDKINILILEKKFSQAEQQFASLNSYDWKSFFNIGNLYLLKSYFKIQASTGDYIKDIQAAISSYKASLDTAPAYTMKKKIVYNYDIAKNLLSFGYVYFCDNLFIKMIYLTKEILAKLDEVITILKQQDEALKKWYAYKS